MNIMNLRKLILAALLIPSLALAANTATVSWTPATTHTDGTPLSGTPWFNVYQGPAGAETKVQNQISATSYLTTTGLVGTVCWRITQVELATALESDFSTEVCKTFLALPNAPTSVQVR